MTAIQPGPLNHLCDVAGIAVGHAADVHALTGVTVILPDRRVPAAVDIRGGGPGSRETALLASGNSVEAVDSLVLAGGSVFGLDAAGAVVEHLAAARRGLAVGDLRIPIVPGAVVFDLTNGGDKPWMAGGPAPYRALAIAAVEAAEAGGRFDLGNVGAGMGAKARTLKSGVGSASTVDGTTGVTIGALAVVNPFGTAVQPGSDTLWAWALERSGELGGQRPPGAAVAADHDPVPPNATLGGSAHPGGNTTLMVVAVDAALDRSQLQRIAMMAQDGLPAAIRPAHTPFDGDMLFALSAGDRPLAEPIAWSVARIGALAADTVARAIARGVFAAEALGDYAAYREVHRAGFGHAG